MDWAYKGMRTLILDNEFLRLVVLLDKGTDIIEFTYKPVRCRRVVAFTCGLQKPYYVHTQFARALGAFDDLYGGGWQDILPSAGIPSKHRGAEWGTHGETPLLKWDCSIESESGNEASSEGLG